MVQSVDTVVQLLDVAERLCRERGYNGFSYRDLAEAVGIKTASIHYHFPSKSDLGKAIVVRYRQAFETARITIERQETSAIGRLGRLFALLGVMYGNADKICLAGVMAAEAGSLPEEVRDEVRRFFEENEQWLAATLALGIKQKNLRVLGTPKRTAQAIFAAIEGAILAARTFNDASRIGATGDCLLASLKL